MKLTGFSSVRVVCAASCLSALAEGFVAVPGMTGVSITSSSRSTQLHGRRVIKRGDLGRFNSDDTDSSGEKAIITPRRSQKQQRKAGSSRKKGGKTKTVSATPSAGMSPDLAKFLEVSGDDNGGDIEVAQKTKTRRSSKSERREKQKVKTIQDKARGAKIEAILDDLQEVLGERTGNVGDILAIVEKLLQIPSNDNGDLRRLLSARARSDYRLAWVGSDEAICHLGTGLHKVPLARMQEVFMNCLGRKRIEVLEVISLIGPFPNVKNVLQGTTTISSGGDGSGLQIVMDTMVDGTGKQINPGTDDNIRRVDLEVAFCDERAIVVLMPEDDNANANPLDNDGKRVLLFVREDDLDEQLEKYRVNELD